MIETLLDTRTNKNIAGPDGPFLLPAEGITKSLYEASAAFYDQSKDFLPEDHGVLLIGHYSFINDNFSSERANSLTFEVCEDETKTRYAWQISEAQVAVGRTVWQLYVSDELQGKLFDFTGQGRLADTRPLTEEELATKTQELRLLLPYANAEVKALKERKEQSIAKWYEFMAEHGVERIGDIDHPNYMLEQLKERRDIRLQESADRDLKLIQDIAFTAFSLYQPLGE